MTYFVAIFIVPVAVVLCGAGGRAIGAEYVAAGPGTETIAALLGGMAGLFYSLLAVRGLTLEGTPFAEGFPTIRPFSVVLRTLVAILAISLGVLAIRSDQVREPLRSSRVNVSRSIESKVKSWDIGVMSDQRTHKLPVQTTAK